MFNAENGYSLADIAAATKNDEDGFGTNNGAWWIIILFLFMFMGWGNNGYGANRGAQDALTRGELCQDMNFSDLEAGVRGIQSGLCDGFYAMNTGMLNGFAGVQQSLTNGFSGVDNAICTLGYQTAQGFNEVNVNNMQNTFGLQQAINSNTVAGMQNTNTLAAQINNVAADQAACCCEIQRQIEKGFSDTNYNLATQECQTRQTIQNTGRDIIDNQNCNTRSILDFLVQDKISSLQAENQALKFAASQTAQNQYLVNELRPCPIPAYITCNPWASNYGVGYNSCNCNCGSY